MEQAVTCQYSDRAHSKVHITAEHLQTDLVSDGLELLYRAVLEVKDRLLQV